MDFLPESSRLATTHGSDEYAYFKCDHVKILVSTSTFATDSPIPLQMLREKKYEITLNPHKRKLSMEELVALAHDCEGIIAGTEEYNAAVFSKLPKLKAISRCGAGMDNVDLEAAKKAGVAVANTPDAPTQAVAELAVCLMLDASRRVSLMDRQMRQGEWKKQMGRLLDSKTVGIVGLGRIGKKVAMLLKGFGVTLVACDPFPDNKWISENGVRLLSLQDLLKISDIVTLHIPQTKENDRIIDSKKLGMMKKGAMLVNTSRGSLVDEEALLQSLQSHHLSVAALDVMQKEPYDGPLKQLDNVVLTPHIGAYAVEARIRMETEAAQNLIRILG
jgi:D-3-phosphoglycerate dehydrogenase / 2-oxoglutarate reductase